MRSPLYFQRFVAQFGCRMTRRFFGFSILILFLAFAQIPLFAEATNAALAESAIYETDVAYLRVGEVGKNLADEINLDLDVAITNWWSTTLMVGANVPETAARQTTGGGQTWFQAGLWSSWTF